MNKQLKNTSCFDRSKLQQKQNLSVRELTKILFNTLKDENGLAIRMIVRNYNNKQMENKNVKQIRNMATNSSI